MEFLKIVLLCIVGAVAYGLTMDQITARICVEYFSIGHPPIFHTESPTFLALGWGVLATWWVGLILGVGLGAAARAGGRPVVQARELSRPIVLLMLSTGLSAVLAGVVGHALAKSGTVWLVGPLATRVPKEKHVAFLTDAWAHSVAYLAAFVGGGWLCIRTWRRRRNA